MPLGSPLQVVKGFFWGQRVGGTDHRYLEFHHGSWRVVVGWRVNGKIVKARRSLGTGSLREAQRRRWAVVAELKAGGTVSRDSPAQGADGWRAALAAGDGSPDDPTPILFHDHLEALEAKQGTAMAFELAQQVYQTPLDLHLQAFITARGDVGVDTRVRHERAVRDLSRWLPTKTVEAVTRKLAIQYVDTLPPGRHDPQRLSLYWQWMVRREMAPADPWSGLQAAQRARVEPLSGHD